MTPESLTGGALKELTKEPLVYVLAVMFGAGAYLVKDSSGTSLYVGMGLICLAALLFVIKFVSALLDNSFKHRYDDLIKSQANTINNQTAVIDAFSKNTIDAHRTMAAPPERFGNYVPVDEPTTSTEPSRETPRS